MTLPGFARPRNPISAAVKLLSLLQAMQLASLQSIQSPATPPWLAAGNAITSNATISANPVHRQTRTIGTLAELGRLLEPSPRPASLSTAAAADPILGGELVIRVIDAQVREAVSRSYFCMYVGHCYVMVCTAHAVWPEINLW